MSNKILLVDDDVNILNGFKRSLRKKYEFETALGGESGLEIIKSEGPFAVIVSDMRMPGMNGDQFLAQARSLNSDAVRILLTGQADLNETIAAINEGHIFRFLSKPCSPEMLAKALEDGLAQYHLVTAEKELLEKTLKGSIKLLMDVLSSISPDTFSRSTQLRTSATKIASRLNMKNIWEVDLAALLSQIGCVTLPPDILNKKYQGQALTDEEKLLFVSHPKIGKDLLINIPRLQGIAEAIAYQEKQFDGGGFPHDNIKGTEIPIIARILKATLDCDALTAANQTSQEAFETMLENQYRYDPDVLSALEAEILNAEEGFIVQEISLNKIAIGMILADDIRSASGTLLVPKNHEISRVLKIRIMNFAQSHSIAEPIKILDWIEKKDSS